MSEARNAVASATSPLFEMGVRAERERIIALLEVNSLVGIAGHRILSLPVDAFIELIEEDTNE